MDSSISAMGSLVRQLQKLIQSRIKAKELPGCKRLVISECEDGQSAVAMVEKARSDPNGHEPQVITMDAHMPTMDGMEATRKVRDMGYQGLIFGCTENSQFDDRSNFQACG